MRADIDMRFLHLISGGTYGGMERTVATLAAVPEADVPAAFALCHEGRLSRELAESGRKCVDLGEVRLRYPWQLARARARLRRLLRSLPMPVAVCHGFWAACAFGDTLQRARVPWILWTHEVAEGHGWMEAWVRRLRPDLVLACSQYGRATLRPLWRGQRDARVLHNPVWPQVASAGAREAARRRWATPASATVILQVGRMEALKGHRLHLEALAQLGTAREWVAWFAGGPQRSAEQAYFRSLKAEARERGLEARVRWLGEQNDMRAVYAGADIVCHPNTGPDVFPLAVVEAMSAGKPVVATHIGGAQEALDSECGCVVGPEAEALAACLRRWIEAGGELQRMGEAGRRRAHALCDASARTADLAALARALPRTQTAAANRPRMVEV